MPSRYYYSSSSSSAANSYAPVSPPSSRRGSPPQTLLDFDGPPRAPAMPYAPLPPIDPYPTYAHVSPHHGIITPPPTPGEIHPALSSRSTVVRYDFAADPRTARMSSSAPNPIFPAWDPAANPSQSFMTIECEASGQVVTVRSNGAGITCADIFSQLHRYFAQPIRPDEWRRVRDPQLRAMMKAAFTRRTGRPYDHHASADMRMIDYLLGQTKFSRLVPKRGDMSGSTWILQTSP